MRPFSAVYAANGGRGQYYNFRVPLPFSVYSVNTFSLFLVAVTPFLSYNSIDPKGYPEGGRQAKNVMYEQFFNFMGLREDPFHVSPDPRFYYSTPAHESALAELMFGIETRQGFLVLTGEAGTGKTSLLNQILDWLHRRRRSTAYIFHAHLEPIGLLRFILSDFGVPCQSKSKSELVNALHTWLRQRHASQDLPVLILDEAQALPDQTLDELRLLLNLETPRGKLLQIILSGQPELDDKLRQPGLRQLRQRIMVHSRLPVLTEKETAAYISSRLATAGCTGSSLFPDEALEGIYKSSRGIPRVVNLLCEHALISAYAEQRRVISSEMIQRIAADFDLAAHPLAVTELEMRPHYTRLAPFPAVEKPAPMASPAPVVAHPVVRTEPVSAAPPPMAPLSTDPLIPTKYWRQHVSHSRFAVLARNSANSVRNAWQTFTQTVWGYARSARLALFPASKNPEPPSLAKQRVTPTWWAQIDFDIFRDARTAASDRSEMVSIEDSLPAVAPEVPVETPRYWRKHRSYSGVKVFARNSAASVPRAWHACMSPLVSYVRSVYCSFVRDCRLMFRGVTPPRPALAVQSSVEPNQPSLTRRRVLKPVVNWLRQPMTPSHISSNRTATRSAQRR
jgi:general secretion pathway protein A